MFKLSKKADYALIIITYLANHKQGYVSVRQISDNTHIPYKFASQIATDLKKSQLITSKEGIGGGYKLAQSPEKITLKLVTESVEGPITPVSCLKGSDCACQRSCYHQDAITQLGDSLGKLMEEHSIASLLKTKSHA